jgi:hypothetical protein
MHLGSYNHAASKFDLIRELRSEEIGRHAKFTPMVAEARQRLSLFRMLDRNYREWKRYLNRLLSADFKEDLDMTEELDRLMLNYLTFAYTIQEHFAVSFRQRFRKDQDKVKEYDDFIKRVCEHCWEFAFVLDFRGYVQHVGLAVGRSNRVTTDTSITVEAIADAATLLQDNRTWPRSHLSADKGEIDLVNVLREFHVQMIQSYGNFVAKTFFPELKPAADFYGELTKEVQERDPKARMVFFEKRPEFSAADEGRLSGRFQMSMVANDVFAELGIKVESV